MDKDHRLVKRQVKLEMSAKRFAGRGAKQPKQNYAPTPTSGAQFNQRSGVNSQTPRSKQVRSQYEEPDVVLVDSPLIDSDDDYLSDEDQKAESRSTLTASHPVSTANKSSNKPRKAASQMEPQDNSAEAHKNLKRLAKSGNHLLNFNYGPRGHEGPRDPIPRRRANISSLPYKRERFLQANYRFMVSPGDFEENMTDADSIIEWDSVEQVLYPTPVEYECVICLFPPTCAKIAKCGHVFCHGCMLRYFTYLQQGTQSMPCPICLKERIFLKDLKSVQFIHVPKYAIGDSARFDLIRRPKHVNSLSLCAPNPDATAVDDSLADDELPVWGDRHSAFNRLVVSYDLGEVQRREAQELEDAIRLADSSREDSLPFLLASQERLLARAKEIEPLVQVQRTLHAQRIAQHLTRRKLAPPTEDDHFFFYQSTDGQHLFLHPINVKWLVLEFGSHSKFPFNLEAKILDMEDMTQTEQTRKRYKYLGHLPISADFKFVLVDLDSILTTPENKSGFKEDVKARADQLREKRLEQDRRLKANARKPADPYRVAMEYHFAPPSAALEDQFDLDSPEAFPSVGGAVVETTASIETVVQEQPKPKGAWTSGASKLVKNAVDEYPALPGATATEGAGPKPVTPAPLPAWGKSAASTSSTSSQTKSTPTPQPAQAAGAAGKKKKKMVLLMSAPQQKN